MKNLHLTMMIFFQVLLASSVLYLTSPTAASPLLDHLEPHAGLAPSSVVAPVAVPEPSKVVKEYPVKPAEKKQEVLASPVVVGAELAEKKADYQQPAKDAKAQQAAADLKGKSEVGKDEIVASSVLDKKVEPAKSEVYDKPSERKTQVSASPVIADAKKPAMDLEPVKPSLEQQPAAAAPTATPAVVAPEAPVVPAVAQSGPAYSAATPAVVKGGLGPLHLLATTLCSYQPDRPVADDCLNQLYARRAVLRKSLFEFMSLKFTNLEKLSSRLGSGLEVVPVRSVAEPAAVNGLRAVPGPVPATPSHGWPVVGKCTAHDLKLMGEAAWCENELPASSQQQDQQPAAVPTLTNEEAAAKIVSNKHLGRSARSAGEQSEASPPLASPEQSAVISKLLHVSDIKDAPLVESSIYNLNLTQQQLATLEAHATSTRECRRNALRYTKALFKHLAEDQKSTSESWPKLYGLISADDCARERMIDIVTALSGFRTDVTSIRRDNLEFAFAMDDLRTKVLENEINVALTFDKQFIEVEQFLQQSVQLMLSNIDPNRAKITSMRYRSLMYSTGQSDDQCIELHQRLLAQNYPTDCNPTQFGQLPDVLRMTASSLELWSIEKKISLHMSRVVDYPNSSPAGQQKVKQDVNECIANLVSS